MNYATAERCKRGDTVFWAYPSKEHDPNEPLTILDSQSNHKPIEDLATFGRTSLMFVVEDSNGFRHEAPYRYFTKVSRYARQFTDLLAAIQLLMSEGYTVSYEDKAIEIPYNIRGGK